MEISATLTEKIVFLSVEANIMMDIAILQKSALAVAMKAGNDESFFAKSKRAICQARSTQRRKVFPFSYLQLGNLQMDQNAKRGVQRL